MTEPMRSVGLEACATAGRRPLFIFTIRFYWGCDHWNRASGHSRLLLFREGSTRHPVSFRHPGARSRCRGKTRKRAYQSANGNYGNLPSGCVVVDNFPAFEAVVYLGAMAWNDEKLKRPIRVVYQVTLRTAEADGQLLLTPLVEADVYWTTLTCAPSQVFTRT